jgi:hypothetical protein
MHDHDAAAPTRGRSGRRASLLLGLASLAAGALLLVGMVGLLVVSHHAGGYAYRAGAAAPVAATMQEVGRELLPVRVEIPAIGVSAPVVRLGLDRAGTLEVPGDFASTGWWSGGAPPGGRGPAVIVGHVDSRTGPAVFFELGELRRGDAITVERADGSRVRFRVERSAHYPKSLFPTAQVYGPGARPTLRLITCSGAFDRASGHYLDNTVVYAGLWAR